MIIPLEPTLEGLAERRFFSFARQVLDRQAAGDPARIRALVEGETTRASGLRDLGGQCDDYTACVRVLGDLAQLRWRLVESGYGIELHSPRPQDDRVADPAQSRLRKAAIRNELRPRVLQQFSDPNVRKFIRSMEHPPVSSKHKSIRRLIAHGGELQDRLQAARNRPADDPTRTELLSQAVRPYLQLVDADRRDDHTGLRLRDIWRYMRYTWSIPQTPIPGRSLHYLVRDAAHKTHAIVGIAALNNCAVQLVPRDRAIGWCVPGLLDALMTLFAPHDQRAAREAKDPALRSQGIYQWLKALFPDGVDPPQETKRGALERIADWLLRGISTAIGEIECQGLVSDDEVARPRPHIIEHLRYLGREFAARRQEALAGRVDNGIAMGNTIHDIPVDDDVLDLEAKHSSNARVQDSRRMLVRKKRAVELARLLYARRVLIANRDSVTDPLTAFVTIEQDEVRTAINTAFSAIKSRRIGTNLFEITTCGAVAPYNRMLGGKLVALLLLSPEVAADNRRRYGQRPTIIRSQLKNMRVVPDSTLVWLGTTSLFSHGSSQYKRLRLPAGVITADQPEIRYTYLGNTTGYGTIQFADDTVRALERVMRNRRGYRDVNSVFGEGASPRMRKLRSGLDAIGFNADLSMLHHQERRIYGAPLFDQAGAYLCGLDSDVPEYIAESQNYTDATERIAEFWRRRWLSSRLAHEKSWSALGDTGPWLLSSTIPHREPPPPDAGEGDSAGSGGGSDDEQRLEFWRRLAKAGSNAVSEGLTDDEFDELHIETPLELYLLDRAEAGQSILLTGNAGDGKTHLARALRRRLGGAANRFKFALDATAMMNRVEGVTPIIRCWRKARDAGKRMVLAINQYPLYMLRQEIREALPDISEDIERQWKARLTAGPGGSDPTNDSLILVDLSLRNPLSREFSGRVLDKILADPVVQRHAASGMDSNFAFNFERLANEGVQERLFELFDRVISSGRRTTVRELWILTARLLFGASIHKETPGASEAWYSERLFAPDERFPLCNALQSVADPAGVSHPHVDRCLEKPQDIQPAKWRVGSEPPVPLRSPASIQGRAACNKYRQRFLALKRRFYFEHADGGKKIFELDLSSHGKYHEMLRHPTADADHLGMLVKAINRSYCPRHFQGAKDNLYLWIGHRLDEQPTKSFIADEYIPRPRLRIQRPEPPGALTDAIAYVPDHLLLSVAASPDSTSPEEALRIDAALFRILWAILHGLPRHLINPSELNRLDAFMDRLRRMEPSQLPEFFIHNTEHVTSSVVKMSRGLGGYHNVRHL